jgi:hypothetical protein
MHRFALFAMSALLLNACSKEAEVPANDSAPVAAGSSSFAGVGRDRLCLAPEGRAAFITYGDGDANCSARGGIEGAGGALTLIPEGDTSCRIPLTRSGDTVELGALAPECAYYCGPKASFAGKSFKRMTKSEPVKDLAGDPLC